MDTVSLEAFTAAAGRWLDAHAPRRPADASEGWGTGDDSVAVFHNIDADEERAVLARAGAWQRTKLEGGTEP